MSSHLVSMLHHEEHSLVAELRASKPFQRLEGIRRLLALYDAQPSVATGLDQPATEAAGRPAADVVHLAPAAPQPAIPLPGPAAAAAAQAEAAVADAVRAPAPAMAVQEQPESASVVSSVRAALLGIGKG